MGEEWRSLIREFVDSYKAIRTLQDNGLMDEDEVAVYEHNLLHNIIKIMSE